MIEVDQLTKYYGSFLAVDRVSFEVPDGEIVGILGPNGAGKTTVLRMLTCFMPATSGRATVEGYDIFTQSLQVRRHIGYMPENVPLYEDMRVEEYLGFRGRLRDLSGSSRRRRIGEVLERCQLTDRRRQLIGTLSKGYRQRVGLAEALLGEPRVLVLDEPTIGLDPAQIREARGLLQDLARRHTILLSSHILHEVEQVCSRIIMIARGRLVANGTLDELKASLPGGTRTILEGRGDEADGLRRALAALQGVARATMEEAGEGWTRLVIEADGDRREAAAHTATSRGWTLREIRTEVPTLEDVFIGRMKATGAKIDEAAA